MTRRLLMLVLLLVSAPSAAAPAWAHGAEQPWIWLEREQAEPGERLAVLVVDFTPHGEVGLELVADERRERLGTITCAADGHGEGEFVVPADFPRGYAELVARDAAGTEATTLVGIGVTGAVGPPETPRSPSVGPGAAAPIWQDRSVLILAGLLGAALLALAYVVVRRRRASPTGAATAAMPAPGGGRVPAKKRRSRRR